MKCVTIVLNNAETSEFYGIVNHFIRYSTKDNLSILTSWKRCMEESYRIRDIHCMVFNNVDIPMLKKVAKYFLNTSPDDLDKRYICVRILDVIDYGHRI